MCGRAFGHKTQPLPQLTPDVLRQHGVASADMQTIGTANSESVTPPQPTNRTLLWVGLALLAVIIVLSVVLLMSLS